MKQIWFYMFHQTSTFGEGPDGSNTFGQPGWPRVDSCSVFWELPVGSLRLLPDPASLKCAASGSSSLSSQGAHDLVPLDHVVVASIIIDHRLSALTAYSPHLRPSFKLSAAGFLMISPYQDIFREAPFHNPILRGLATWWLNRSWPTNPIHNRPERRPMLSPQSDLNRLRSQRTASNMISSQVWMKLWVPHKTIKLLSHRCPHQPPNCFSGPSRAGPRAVALACCAYNFIEIIEHSTTQSAQVPASLLVTCFSLAKVYYFCEAEAGPLPSIQESASAAGPPSIRELHPWLWPAWASAFLGAGLVLQHPPWMQCFAAIQTRKKK